MGVGAYLLYDWWTKRNANGVGGNGATVTGEGVTETTNGSGDGGGVVQLPPIQEELVVEEAIEASAAPSNIRAECMDEADAKGLKKRGRAMFMQKCMAGSSTGFNGWTSTPVV